MNAAETRKYGDPLTSRDRKGGLSCAECRRSKLKCDRVFPCQSCIRRGCDHLCPDGTLTATKGNKVLMAHAQRLTEQVRSMSSRIQELEMALHRSSTGDTLHPLLRVTQTDDETPRDSVLQDVSEAIGSLSIVVDGQAKYHGCSAGSEYFQDLLSLDETEHLQSPEPEFSDLPFELVELMNSFPFGIKGCLYRKHLFVPFLPSRQRALQLANLYYKNVAWMYDPIVVGDFTKTILSPIYGNSGIANLHTLHPHCLSVFFILLATGILYEDHPSSSTLAEQYHALARAALSLDSVLTESTCATVQALFMMFRYIYSSDRSSNETRWLLTGLCCRVAQTIGLQRDSAGWNLEPDEVQRRRIMFWELYTYDAWTSLVNGRPPALNIQHADCRFPDDLDPSVKPSGNAGWGWHAWKFRYSASCLSISIQHAFGTKATPYATLLELDKKIRKFPLPPHLQSPFQASEIGRAWSGDPSRAMQQYCAICERESNLLYIHRSYFAQAIRENSQNPLRHKYAPSVIATYRSACRVILSLRGLYAIHPVLSSRIWFFWSGIFSACIVLGALVVESPGCTLARNALHELEQTLAFYDEGSRPCRPPSTLIMLQRLQQRASVTFATFHTGIRNANVTTHKVSDDSNAPDELEVLGGRKIVISSKSSANTAPSNPAFSPPASSEERNIVSQQGSEDVPMEYSDEFDGRGFEQTAYEVGPSGERAYFTAYLGAAELHMGQLPSAHQHHQNTGVEAQQHQLSAAMGRPASRYPAAQHHMSSFPLGDITTSDALMQNQDDIWRNFIHQLGLQGSNP